ncbi:hypothetical protein ACJRO7_006120 [Eucalyptus globulus]|uniref:TraB domain-containing protein n=1 Tax=Eucalyptus globulus TaxID=34317 RepID=A0ABD3IGM4_EUCGL
MRFLSPSVGCGSKSFLASMDTILGSTFPVFTPRLALCTPRTVRPFKASIRSPPPSFDFQSEVLEESRASIALSHPELLDLAGDMTLVLVRKGQFGPVPTWRSEFVEPVEIWLVGTTHISRWSADDVARVVRTVRPDNVVVELCRSSQQLQSSMFSLSGTGFFGAVGRSINLGGQTALAFRLLLFRAARKVSEEIGARKVSEEIGAQIVLGDQPIEITLERASSSLKWDQKISLVVSVFRGIAPQSDASGSSLQESNTGDSTLELYKQLSFSYPALLQPLIHERDTYLAWSLKRSKAVNNCKRVVGVIGKGHMNGVALISDQGKLRCRDLAGNKAGGSKTGGWVEDLTRSLIRDTLLGILLWALYEWVKAYILHMHLNCFASIIRNLSLSLFCAQSCGAFSWVAILFHPSVLQVTPETRKENYYDYTSSRHVYRILSMISWFWSAVSHSRCGLHRNAGLFICGFITQVFSHIGNTESIYEAARVMVTTPLIAFVTIYILYLNFYKLNHVLHMKACVAMAVAQILIWAVWAAASMLLEMHDLPPYQGYVDDRALWHATTIPSTFLWWRFTGDDADFRTATLLKKKEHIISQKT